MGRAVRGTWQNPHLKRGVDECCGRFCSSYWLVSQCEVLSDSIYRPAAADVAAPALEGWSDGAGRGWPKTRAEIESLSR